MTASPRLWKITVAVSLLAMMFSASGCSALRDSTTAVTSKLKLPKKEAEKEKLKAGPTKVLTDATAVALELPESDLQARSKFQARFRELIDAKRDSAADLLVARNLDHAYELLTQFDQVDANSLALALAYDRAIGNQNGWHALLSAGKSEPVSQYHNQRKQFYGAISNGNFDATSRNQLVAKAQETGHEVLLVDAWYQTGVGHLLREENELSAAAFSTCAQLAGDRHGTLGANALLLASEASRRAGDYATAGQSWNGAIELACQQMRTKAITEPVFWDRAIHLHPVGAAWPSCIAETLASIGSGQASVLRTELLRQLAADDKAARSLDSGLMIEAAMGSWREARGESEKALIHLKRAETRASGVTTEWLRIAQAPLLVSLGQPGTATTLLAPIIAKEDNAPTTLAAMAKLGVIKLKNNSAKHGVRLLQEAAGNDAQSDWPGQSGAVADLALGLLMVGETSAGLDQLARAQAMFESEGEVELLAKSLWNQKQYLEHSDAKKATVAVVSDRLESMRL